MSGFQQGRNRQLKKAEEGVDSCSNIDSCDGSTPCSLELSDIQPRDERRGSRDPVILLVTEAPDKESSQGSAYAGSTSSRVISLFYNEEYGIQIGGDYPDSFEEFLIKNRIYSTSAIKCSISACQTQNVGTYVVDSCRKKFLTNQIESMNNLEIIIPMGKIAAASILEKRIANIGLKNLIGITNRGIFTKKTWGGPEVVVFPHPSGLNRLSNPPLLKDGESASVQRYKIQFRDALSHVRRILKDQGYDVPDQRPDMWDRPSGLSDYI